MIAQLMASRRRRTFRLFAPKSGNSRNATSAPARAIGPWKGERAGVDREFSDRRVAELAFTSVAIVSVEVADPETVGAMLLDEKVQVVFCGRLPHARPAAELKPLTDVTVTVITAEVPAAKLPLDGESVTVYAAGPDQTETATAEEMEATLFMSPA
jgi:hypothetical protein